MANTKRIGKLMPVKKTWLEKKEAKEFLGGCSDDWLYKLMSKEAIEVSVIFDKSFYSLESLEKVLKDHVIIQRITS